MDVHVLIDTRQGLWINAWWEWQVLISVVLYFTESGIKSPSHEATQYPRSKAVLRWVNAELFCHKAIILEMKLRVGDNISSGKLTAILCPQIIPSAVAKQKTRHPGCRFYIRFECIDVSSYTWFVNFLWIGHILLISKHLLKSYNAEHKTGIVIVVADIGEQTMRK